jgi:hypothetical protein
VELYPEYTNQQNAAVLCKKMLHPALYSRWSICPSLSPLSNHIFVSICCSATDTGFRVQDGSARGPCHTCASPSSCHAIITRRWCRWWESPSIVLAGAAAAEGEGEGEPAGLDPQYDPALMQGRRPSATNFPSSARFRSTAWSTLRVCSVSCQV